METAKNPYELAARNLKAARIAIAAIRHQPELDAIGEGWANDTALRQLAAVIGVNDPSDETLKVVRMLVADPAPAL
jgi:hypothetical protein